MESGKYLGFYRTQKGSKFGICYDFENKTIGYKVNSNFNSFKFSAKRDLARSFLSLNKAGKDSEINIFYSDGEYPSIDWIISKDFQIGNNQLRIIGKYLEGYPAFAVKMMKSVGDKKFSVSLFDNFVFGYKSPLESYKFAFRATVLFGSLVFQSNTTLPKSVFEFRFTNLTPRELIARYVNHKFENKVSYIVDDASIRFKLRSHSSPMKITIKSEFSPGKNIHFAIAASYHIDKNLCLGFGLKV